jgi:hypothetical protein
MPKTESIVANAVATPVLTMMTGEFVDLCCWQQILQILEENGFGVSNRTSRPINPDQQR